MKSKITKEWFESDEILVEGETILACGGGGRYCKKLAFVYPEDKIKCEGDGSVFVETSVFAL